ncbi:hypothetical protein EV715DRAFT_295479 [Schizophyllum commune]
MQFFSKIFAAVALFAVAASAMPASGLEIETRADVRLDHLPPRWAAYLLRVLRGVMKNFRMDWARERGAPEEVP